MCCKVGTQGQAQELEWSRSGKVNGSFKNPVCSFNGCGQSLRRIALCECSRISMLSTTVLSFMSTIKRKPKIIVSGLILEKIINIEGINLVGGDMKCSCNFRNVTLYVGYF